MGFFRQEYWSGLSWHSPGDLPNPGIEPRCPTLQVDSLPTELPGKPKNTGVCSLSLLQGNFLSQELILGLQHCRWILDQLSYQFSSVQFSHSVISKSLWPHGLQHIRLLCRAPTPGACSNLCFHQVDDAIQTSHPLSSPFPPAFNISYNQGLFQWVSSSHQVAKVLELQLQH